MNLDHARFSPKRLTAEDNWKACQVISESVVFFLHTILKDDDDDEEGAGER